MCGKLNGSIVKLFQHLDARIGRVVNAKVVNLNVNGSGWVVIDKRNDDWKHIILSSLVAKVDPATIPILENNGLEGDPARSCIGRK